MLQRQGGLPPGALLLPAGEADVGAPRRLAQEQGEETIGLPCRRLDAQGTAFCRQACVAGFSSRSLSASVPPLCPPQPVVCCAPLPPPMFPPCPARSVCLYRVHGAKCVYASFPSPCFCRACLRASVVFRSNFSSANLTPCDPPCARSHDAKFVVALAARSGCIRSTSSRRSQR